MPFTTAGSFVLPFRFGSSTKADTQFQPQVDADLQDIAAGLATLETQVGGTGSAPGGSPGNVQYNNSGAFGGITDTQLTARINAFTSTLSGAAPFSGGGTVNFLRADGAWATPPGGGTSSPGGLTGNIQYNNAGSFGGLTDTQVTARINAFTATLSGAVPASGGGSTSFLRSDGVWQPFSGAVSSVANTDSSLTIFPTSGAVIASINLAHHNTWTTDQTFTKLDFSFPTFPAANGFGVNDRTSQPSDPGSFWSSIMHRMNRLYIGLFATTDGNNHDLQSPTVLTGAYGVAETQNCQLGVMSSMGMTGINVVARASDYVAWAGGGSLGTEAIIGWGINDDTTFGSIAVGANLIGIAASGIVGTTVGTQNDINSACTSVVIDPFNGFPSGTTIATLATSGAYAELATQNTSAAYVINDGGQGRTFNAGIVFSGACLSQPGGAKGIAISLPHNYAVVWYNNTGVKGGSIFVDPSGNMNITCTGSVLINGVTLTVP